MVGLDHQTTGAWIFFPAIRPQKCGQQPTRQDFAQAVGGGQTCQVNMVDHATPGKVLLCWQAAANILVVGWLGRKFRPQWFDGPGLPSNYT